MSIFDFTVKALDGSDYPLAQHKGKDQFGPKGFQVIAFPCNQFGLQENSVNEEIMPTLQHVRPGGGFVPNFPLMDRVKCNGDETSPVYGLLKGALPDVAQFDAHYIVNSHQPKNLQSAKCAPTDVQWNFEKFLVDKEGKPVKRYMPKTMPGDIAPDIEALLK